FELSDRPAPAGAGLLNPRPAGAAWALSCVLVVTNTLRRRSSHCPPPRAVRNSRAALRPCPAHPAWQTRSDHVRTAPRGHP
ncbi:hypothetical protein, partial [Nocardia wallacei]|uniref:hypothetical protein n=1 Tax=Nocardia wallacei TaxID=480035 RepID=UPI003CC7F9CC